MFARKIFLFSPVLYPVRAHDDVTEAVTIVPISALVSPTRETSAQGVNECHARDGFLKKKELQLSKHCAISIAFQLQAMENYDAIYFPNTFNKMQM